MVLLTTTPSILHTISTLSASDITTLSTSSSSSSLPTNPGSPIDHKLLIRVSRLTRKNVSLNTLLRGTRIYTPPPQPKPAPSAEYIALMAKLRRDQEEKEYRLLTSQNGQDGTGTIQQAFVDSEGEISSSLVLNILLSIVMCGGAMFYVTRYWRDAGVRVLVSLAVAVVVGVAEVTVYAAYLRKVRISREKERGKREVKVVIAEDVDLDEVKRGELEVEGTEEIWGKGVNGGMRRRVRDRYEKNREKVG